MELLNEFVVPLKVEDAWELLTDVGKIAGCMPGAKLEEATDSMFRGSIKIKIGPVTPTFVGHAVFLLKDPVEHKAILQVEGRDKAGQGFAKGTITASLFFSGKNESKVLIQSSLTISGRMAQFGRDVVGDISDKLFKQFVTCLEKDLLHG